MEHWKAIPGYEGLYEASSFGRIRTAEGKTTSNARYPSRVWKQRIMKQKLGLRKGKKGFDARVIIWKDGKPNTFLVSRLIAMTWCDGYQEGFTVNHKDGNPLNNRASNLEWISLADNIKHGFENGLYTNQKQCTLLDKNGLKKVFRSQSEASRAIGRNTAYIANCRSKGKKIISANGELYDYIC